MGWWGNSQSDFILELGRTSGKPQANLVPTSCQPCADLMSTSCRPQADLMPTLCRPHANLGQTSCQPHAKLGFRILLCSVWTVPTSYQHWIHCCIDINNNVCTFSIYTFGRHHRTDKPYSHWQNKSTSTWTVWGQFSRKLMFYSKRVPAKFND